MPDVKTKQLVSPDAIGKVRNRSSGIGCSTAYKNVDLKN
jgi:hypothetical protein